MITPEPHFSVLSVMGVSCKTPPPEVSVIGLCSGVFVVVVLAGCSVTVVAELISVLGGATSQSGEELQCSCFSVITASCVEGTWSFVISWAVSESEMRSFSKEHGC